MIVHEPNGAAYADVMASKGVLVFGLLQQHRASFFQKHPKLTWSYLPSIEQSVEQFTDWACTKVIGHPVSFGGNDSDPDSRLHNGQPRRIGIIRVGPKYPAWSDFADLAAPRLQECGAEIVATVINPAVGTFPSAPATYDSNIAALKQAGVSTVVWLQGFDLEHSKRAARINYFPEWVIAGDRNHEDLAIAKQQDRKAWAHAWIWTNVPLFTGQAEEQCFMAAREAEPNLDIRDSALPCRLYDDLRQVFTGIQVAGPRLHPDTVDKGFHAIPGNRSSSPKTPACFYLPGDYTCVKDGVAMWWDSEARSSYSSAPGCYRVAAGAARFRVGDWPPGDVLNQKDPARDPCNGWSAGFWFDPAPGPESRPPQ